MAVRQPHKAVGQIFFGRFIMQEYKIPKISITERHMMAQRELKKPTRTLKSQVVSWLCRWSQRSNNKIFMSCYPLFFTRHAIQKNNSGTVYNVSNTNEWDYLAHWSGSYIQFVNQKLEILEFQPFLNRPLNSILICKCFNSTVNLN